jgi:addiction module HigA family antidote
MKYPAHPGMLIREDILGELQLTVSEGASRLGVSHVKLSQVLNGRAGVSPNLAVRLERAGVGTARFWLSMQTNYDLARELEGGDHSVRPLTAG